MKTSLPLLFVVLSCLTVSAREWTNTAGKALQAEFVQLKGAAGSELVVLKLGSGTLSEVPLAQLSAADQIFAKSAAGTSSPTASGASTAKDTAAKETKPSIFKDMLKGKLVALEGKGVHKYEMAQEPQFYAFYFSAHWCPPCRTFTPKLVEFYNAQEGRKKNFEVILVSSDNDEKSMEEYMKIESMPWPAIAFRSTERLKDIQKYGGPGIPCLVLVDAQGKVVSDSYENGKYVGPTKVMNEIPTKTAPVAK